MNRTFLTTLLILLFSGIAYAQEKGGAEIQVYPAGIIPGAFLDLQIYEESYVTARVGFNFTNRRDWGMHDNEEGSGPGFSLGYRYTGLFDDKVGFTLRTDIWFLEIRWEDERPVDCPNNACPGDTYLATGSTALNVLQPTVGVDYQFILNEDLSLKPSLSFGYEINIRTQGEEVGSGPILLAGLRLEYGF